MNTNSDPDMTDGPDVLRSWLAGRAATLGLPVGDDDAWIDAVLERDVQVPAVDDVACRRYYDAHPREFSSGDLVEAAHILFAVTRDTDVRALVHQAESTLRRLQESPASFDAVAAEFSNCPSGVHGGRLGQLRRGEVVPEIEAVLFDSDDVGVLPRLARSRHGLHILRVDHRVRGERVPFEQARADIEVRLAGLAWTTAARQYIAMLARGRTDDVAVSPLVQ